MNLSKVVLVILVSIFQPILSFSWIGASGEVNIFHPSLPEGDCDPVKAQEICFRFCGLGKADGTIRYKGFCLENEDYSVVETFSSYVLPVIPEYPDDWSCVCCCG